MYILKYFYGIKGYVEVCISEFIVIMVYDMEYLIVMIYIYEGLVYYINKVDVVG